MNEMRPCSVVEIVTPKKVVLNGLWFGTSKPKRVIVWVHGLGSSAFSKLSVVELLAKEDTAVLTFNNRGHDGVSNISRAGESKKFSKGGSAHEVFTDCVDDIDGAINFAKNQGANEIFLAGHSTGCQKSIYWASKRKAGVKGVVLLAPISDYAAEVHLKGKAKVDRAMKTARSLIARGKEHELLPSGAWPQIFDAQRFVSLCAAEGREEIFPYWNPRTNPRTLKSVKVPILALLAENDEYADRPTAHIATWFQKYAKATDRVEIILGVEHGFKGGEVRVCELIGRMLEAH